MIMRKYIESYNVTRASWCVAECGINAHKHCKDLVVMECRSKQHASTHRSSSINNGGTHFPHLSLTLHQDFLVIDINAETITTQSSTQLSEPSSQPETFLGHTTNEPTSIVDRIVDFFASD